VGEHKMKVKKKQELTKRYYIEIGQMRCERNRQESKKRTKEVNEEGNQKKKFTRMNRDQKVIQRGTRGLSRLASTDRISSS
jgi:hypothetical protein